MHEAEVFWYSFTVKLNEALAVSDRAVPSFPCLAVCCNALCVLALMGLQLCSLSLIKELTVMLTNFPGARFQKKMCNCPTIQASRRGGTSGEEVTADRSLSHQQQNGFKSGCGNLKFTLKILWTSVQIEMIGEYSVSAAECLVSSVTLS
mgnify:CR=1 FL=1